MRSGYTVMLFYVGIHHPHHARNFDRAFISMNPLRRRRSCLSANRFIVDSGAFTEITKFGGYRHEPDEYAAEVNRVRQWQGFECAVTQDYMCEPFVLEKTGLSVRDHQRLTIERYRRIQSLTPAYVMPVLQGYKASEYLDHIEQYGDLLRAGMRVGVGSVCKRNASISQIEDVLLAIHEAAPGLLLHGFGVKTTALSSQRVWECLYSADSMAWSFAARMAGRNANDWREAVAFEEKILRQTRYWIPRQLEFAP